MKAAKFLAAVMGAAVASVPVVLTYLFRVKEQHKPEAERRPENRNETT